MKTLTNKCASVEHKDTLSAIYVSEQCWALLRKWKSLSPIRLCYPLGCNSPWNSPGQNTGVGRLSLLQGIFPTQGLNPGLPHCGQILYQLSHKESPRTLEWVAYPFSRGSSQPRNRTRFSCIAGGFFTNWAMREAWDLLWWFGSLVAKSCLTLATPWTVAHQAPLSMGFSRQEYWSGLLFPSPGDLPNPGIELRSSALQEDSLPTELWGKPTCVPAKKL